MRIDVSMKLISDIDEYEKIKHDLKYSVRVSGRKEYALILDSMMHFKSEYGFLEINNGKYKFRFSSEEDLTYLKLAYPNIFRQ